MIELIVFDIDGVITDGTVIVDSHGNEQKRISLKDIDAIFELRRRGYKIAAITGEDTEIVSYFEKRFPWEHFCRGNKRKREAMEQIERRTGVRRENICYVGDGKYDVEPLTYAGLGVCPANAIDRAKGAADIILQNDGGKGCIWELVSILEQYDDKESPHNFFYQRLEEHTNMCKQLASDQELIGTVMEIGDRLIEIFKNGGALYLCGNGESAAGAHEGDMLMGISTSEESKNVLEALRHAGRNGITSVLLTGGSGKPDLDGVADYIVRVPSLITPRIQEAHIFIGHVIAEYVEYKMFGGR